MTETITKRPGDFCWIEHGCNDLSSTTSFYHSLFGWQATTHDMPNNGTYTMYGFSADQCIAGAYQLDAQMRELGIPSHWASYILVDNIDATNEKAKELGATILQEPFDVADMGRMNIMLDPTGARISLWQAKGEIGQQPTPKTEGMFGWQELITDDPDSAKQFYCELLGWTAESIDTPNGYQYTTFFNQGNQIAGMVKKKPEMGDNVHTFWNIYFTVVDFNASKAKAEGLGAVPASETMQVPGVGTFGVMSDPDGANFSMLQYDN